MEKVKTYILDQIIEELKTQIQNAEKGRSHSIEESKSHKGAMTSRYDTFKEEAQYLAGGYSALLVELNKTLGILKFIRNHPPVITTKGSNYTIVEIKDLDNGMIIKYFLLPVGGGNTYEVEGEKITVINVGAPLAHAFIGTVSSDEVKIEIKRNTKRFSIISVS